MAGRFLTAKYEADSEIVHPIRIQPETLFGTNLEPAGGVNVDQRVRVSGSKRAYGIKARSVTLSRAVGTDDDYSGATVYARIPWMTPASWEALAVGSTEPYQGVDWVVASKSAESNR